MSYWDLEFQFCRKIIIFGESNVGKTCFAKRCEQDVFAENPKKTIGVNLWGKRIEVHNIIYTLYFWDFSGEHKFRTMLKMYLKGIDAGIFMFDLSNLRSLLCFDYWMKFIKENRDSLFPIIILGTKNDIVKDEISNKAKQLCKERGIQHYLECSSMTGNNISEVFRVLKKLIGVNNNNNSYDKLN